MKDYINHWLLGIICTVIWLFGKQWNLPPEVVILAASVVPVVVGHALAFTPAQAASSPVVAPIPTLTAVAQPVVVPAVPSTVTGASLENQP